jgi:annexin A7/11
VVVVHSYISLTHLSPGTKPDIEALTRILPKLTALQIDKLRYHIKDPLQITKSVNKQDLSDDAKLVIQASLMGPRDMHVHALSLAFNPSPTKLISSGLTSLSLVKKDNPSFARVNLLSLVLLDRKDGDLEVIINRYRETTGEDLLSKLQQTLTNHPALLKLYSSALENRRDPGLSEVPEASRPHVQQQIDKAVQDIYFAGVGTFDPNIPSAILACSSEERIRDIMKAFQNSKHKKGLKHFFEEKGKRQSEVVDQLVYILDGVEDRAMRDAIALEKSMAGAGTYR